MKPWPTPHRRNQVQQPLRDESVVENSSRNTCKPSRDKGEEKPRTGAGGKLPRHLETPTTFLKKISAPQCSCDIRSLKNEKGFVLLRWVNRDLHSSPLRFAPLRKKESLFLSGPRWDWIQMGQLIDFASAAALNRSFLHSAVTLSAPCQPLSIISIPSTET